MKTILIILLCFIVRDLTAQVFPVQVNVQLVPPYSPYLSDYTAPGAQNLMVSIRANDISLSDYACRLRITIEGAGITIRTKSNFIPRPLLLAGAGIPEIFYGEDLPDYFHPDALDFSGLTRSEYEKTGRLPEGVYRFTIEVLDYNRGTVVSNQGAAMAWIILNDPPLLNLPANFSTVKLQDPANILFTWTPRHSGSPNAAFTTEYTFRLVEVWPENRSPYDAVLAQHPLYETTTFQNQILYGISEPALLAGRKYAWQVEARVNEGKDLFKNNGRSEVFVFQFGEALAVPQNLGMRWAKPTTLAIRWDAVKTSEGEEAKYRLKYRPRRRIPDHEWYETRTKFTEKTLYHLQEDTEYEFKVRTETLSRESEYSEARVFKTLPRKNENFVCRDVDPPPLPDNSLPVFPLSVNDTIRAGGYDVLVRDVMQADGKYFGAGLAIVPWLNSAKVRVTFENIRVNDRFWLTHGTIKSVWNTESRFLLEEQTAITMGNAPKAGELDITVVAADSLITLEGTAIIASVTKDPEGDIVITTTDGNKQTLTKGESYAIVDNAGNGYVVDAKGNIAKTTAAEATAAAARGERRYDHRFMFAKGNGILGFDEKRFDALSHYYEQLTDGGFVAWKALSSSGPDEIEGNLLSAGMDIKSIRYRVEPSWVMPASLQPGKATLRLHGKGAGMEQELLAVYQPADSLPETVLGKINLVTYNSIRYNLVIVPVNGASIPGALDAENISESLNRIYNQAVIEWAVTLDNGLQVPFPDGFDEGETGLLSNYSQDMKKVLHAYGSLDANTYYLFLIEEPGNMATLGYMPRNRPAGFVFIAPHKGNADEFIKTIAHELGHGAFNLKHPFNEFALPAGTTDNLMDYSDGTTLYKYQWDYIHEPGIVLGLFDVQGENAMNGFAGEEMIDWWNDLPPYRKAAEILSEHLEDTGIYHNVLFNCIDDKCTITADLRIGDDITYTTEIAFHSGMSADQLIEVLIFEYRVDLWEAFNVRAENIWDELYHWWRKQNDDLAQQKGWQVSTLNFLSDVITAPTLVPAVQGWITGKHWRDGHELAGWEQALAALDFLVAEEIAKGCITGFIVRVGSQTISLLKIPQPTRALISKAIESGYKLTAVSETEFILKNADGIEIARIVSNNFYIAYNGKNIVIDLTKRYALLGRFTGGTQNFLLAKFQNSNLFNMLNVVEWTKQTAPSVTVTVSEASENALEFWTSFNKHFIDDIITNGDEILLLTKPDDLTNLFHRRLDTGEYFDVTGKTIDVLLTGDISTDIRTLLSLNAFPTMYGREVLYLGEQLDLSIESLAKRFFQ